MTKLYKQLQRDEGNVPHAYQDHLGYWTIGVGILIDKRKGGGLRPEESEFIFKNRMRIFREEVDRKIPFFKHLSEARQGVLLNMRYQMGMQGLLGFTNTLKMVEQGRYADAAKGMLNSLWASPAQTPKRAKRLSIQMETDVWQ